MSKTFWRPKRKNKSSPHVKGGISSSHFQTKKYLQILGEVLGSISKVIYLMFPFALKSYQEGS